LFRVSRQHRQIGAIHMQQKIKTYRSRGLFAFHSVTWRANKDAEKMAKQGWRIHSQSANMSTIIARRSITIVYVKDE